MARPKNKIKQKSAPKKKKLIIPESLQGEHSIQLEEHVFTYISQALIHGESYPNIETSLLNSGVPVDVVKKCISQSKNKGKVLVPKGLFFGLVTLVVIFLLLSAVFGILNVTDNSCFKDSQCSAGAQCIQGQCVNTALMLECEGSLEADGSQGDDFFKCVEG